MSAASLLLLAAAAALLISPALSQSCKSQTFKNRTFGHCSDLPYLNATLHWNYNASALTLSFAFTASPAAVGGWVAYGLNQFGSGMVGTQALVAFAAANGSLVVNTYNLSSAASISESPIGYRVLEKSANSTRGKTTIFATLELPTPTTAVNHTWQVGAAVANRVPAQHAMAADNMASTGTLRLSGVAADSPADSPASGSPGTASPGGSPGTASPGGSPVTVSPGPGGGSPNGNSSSGGARAVGSGFGFGSGFGLYGVLVLLCVSNFGF